MTQTPLHLFKTLIALILLNFLGILSASAHEVSPSIADITITDNQIEIEIRLMAEAVLAEIDLSETTDTNESARVEEYDRLRALEAQALAEAVRVFWPSIQTRLHLWAVPEHQDLSLRLAEVRVIGEENQDLPRFSILRITGSLASPSAVSFAWDSELGNLVLRQQGVENGLTEYLSDGQRSSAMNGQGALEKRSAWGELFSYVPVGFDHIIPKGLDHILFVLGLFFLTLRVSALLWQISAFTLAHTVTLAAGAMGWVTISGSVVEPLIAASIVFVAVENIFSQKLHRWRPALIFGFGLLHGLGFASVLQEFGLPDGQFIAALVGFNIGVEIGQLTVIACAFLLLGVWFGNKPWYRAYISIPSSCLIALIGAYWVIERTILA